MTAFCTTAHAHVLTAADAPDAIAAGRVQLALDHTDPVDAWLARFDGDDAAAVLDLSAPEAVELAHALLRAVRLEAVRLTTSTVA